MSKEQITLPPNVFHPGSQGQQIMVNSSPTNQDYGGASLFEWWQLIILPLVAIIVAWRTVKMKLDAANREKWRRAVAENKEDEYTDSTVLQWARKEMKKDKK